MGGSKSKGKLKNPLQVDVDDKMYDYVMLYCKQNHISQASFLRDLIAEKMSPDGEDKKLQFISLRNLHNKEKSIETKIDTLADMFAFWLVHFYSSTEEVPHDLKASVYKASLERTGRFFAEFQKEQAKNNPHVLEMMAVDLVEEGDE